MSHLLSWPPSSLLSPSRASGAIRKLFKIQSSSDTKTQSKTQAVSKLRASSKMATPLTEAEIERMARRFSKWRHVDHQPLRPRQNETIFSIMSYNILAQENLDSHRHLYQTCPADQLEWAHRSKRILKQILSQGCDIVCLQEVQWDHLEDYLAPGLADAGYRHVFKCKTGDKNEGCAIFWKVDVFGIINWSQVEMRIPGCRVLNRDNIGLVVVLSPLANRQAKLCVATTHLLFNPRRGEVKLAQLRYLLAHVEKNAFLSSSQVSGRPMYVPTILCGDFNATPFCPLYDFVVKGQLAVDGLSHCGIVGNSARSEIITPDELHVGGLLPNTILDRTYVARYGVQSLDLLEDAYNRKLIFHTLGTFQSCYSHKKKGSPEVSSYLDLPQTVDYVFYQRTKLLRLLAKLDLMTAREIEALGRIPNVAMGSDHIPLAARFLLREIPR